MSDARVVVSTARLDDAMRRQVAEACDHARVRPAYWGTSGPESPDGPLSPLLLVAALPAGQRTIPEDIVALATQTFQAVPLLLLCREPLVRHSVSLQGGRVTLLGQPLTREKISARIRTAVVGSPASGDDRGRPATEDPFLRVRELRGREWWAGAIARDPAPVRSSPDAGELLPHLCKLGRHGVAGVVPLNAENPLPTAVLQQAALELGAGLPSDRAAASLEAALGLEAAVVWFCPATYQWSLYVPRSGLELWLYSPMRLPNLWRLGAGGDGGLWRVLPAASGDVVLLAAGDSSGLLAGDNLKDGDALRAAEGGGPALLDHFEARLPSRPAGGSALIVELR